MLALKKLKLTFSLGSPVSQQFGNPWIRVKPCKGVNFVCEYNHVAGSIPNIFVEIRKGGRRTGWKRIGWTAPLHHHYATKSVNTGQTLVPELRQEQSAKTATDGG